MEIKLHKIRVRDVFQGYEDKGDDNGIVAYGGNLDIRPPYQRNFVYDEKDQRAVINTVLHDFPLNIMYWVITEEKNGIPTKFEILDGQQRTLSIMKFLAHQYRIKWQGNYVYEDTLPDDIYDRLMNYELMIYWCKGTTSQKLEWFKTVNIAGLKLTDQELRNITYTGPWLSDAKRYFSKRGCVAKKLAGNYVTGDPNRQEILEKALAWISESKGMDSIEDYMSEHRSDKDANELWQYWQDMVNWIKKIFPTYNKKMKGLKWGHLYNQYSKNTYNTNDLADKIEELLEDDEIKKQSGIWQYVLAKYSNQPEANAEKYLHLRTFSAADKRKKWREQNHQCPMCLKEGITRQYELSEMEGDHITPWSQGGKTTYDNLQMLCKEHNRSKGDK